MNRARTTSLPLAVRLLVPVGLAILYLALRQHIFTIDSMYYLWDAEFAEWRRLLHPHHLALEPLLRAWWRLWQWFGWPGRAVAPIQILNILVSLGSLLVAARLLRLLLRDGATAVGWWLLLGVSYVPWYHATQAEGLPLFVIFGTLNLYWAARLPSHGEAPTVRTAVTVGGVIAGGVLIHQSLVLWAPLLAWMVGREAAPGVRWRYGLGTLFGAGAAVLACYLIAGAWATGSVAPVDLWRWFTGYTQEFAGRCGSLRLLFSADTPRGLASTLLTGAPFKPYAFGGRPMDAAFVLALLPFLLVGTLVAVGIGRLLIGLVLGTTGDRDPGDRRAVINVALLVLLGALFAGWWEPANRKFWAPILPGLLALAAVGWSGWPRRRPRLGMVAVTAAVALAFSFNLAGGILPRHRIHDDRQPMIMFLARVVQPADTVILQEDRVWQCALYFRPQQPVHGLPGPNSDRDDHGHTVLREAVDAAVRTLSGGGALYVTASEWPQVEAEIEAALGPLPEPMEVLRFGDADLYGDEQVLLALRLPLG